VETKLGEISGGLEDALLVHHASLLGLPPTLPSKIQCPVLLVVRFPTFISYFFEGLTRIYVK